MIVGKISCSFYRGLEQNTAEDVVDMVAVEATGANCEPRNLVRADELRRGLGTRYISLEAKEKAVLLGIEEGRVNRLIAREFLRSPIPGLYVVSSRTDLERVLVKINPDPEINCRAVVYVLEATEKNSKEIEEWASTIKNQLKTAPLGRAKEAGAEGLDVIQRLATCPVLSEETRDRILSLVGQARMETLSRIDFKRAIADVEVSMDVSLSELPEVQPGRVLEQPVEDVIEEMTRRDDITFNEDFVEESMTMSEMIEETRALQDAPEETQDILAKAIDTFERRRVV